MSHPTLEATTLGDLSLRNPLVRAGCYEGLSREGSVTEGLIDHHRQLAAGGIGMTTVGYCAISLDGRGFGHQLWMHSGLVPELRRLTETVHREGAAVSIQLVHCGFFADPSVTGVRNIGASAKLCLYRMARCRAMAGQDIAAKVADFARAASLARESGFDAVEIHAGHGYLLSQFLSPWTNHRKDGWGGGIDGRARFAAEVVRGVRESVGTGFPVVVKMNLFDGFRGGAGIEEAVDAARRFEAAGANALVGSCGFTARTPLLMMRGRTPVTEMADNESSAAKRLTLRAFGRIIVGHDPFEPLFLRESAREIRRAVDIPVGYVGGVVSADHIASLLQEGFGFVQLGRATVRDPGIAGKMQRGEVEVSDCDHCNRCIAAMDGDGVRCVSEKEGLLTD